MTWRIAKALETLLDEVDTAAPQRSRTSDGGIGDAHHATRNSDHNPWVRDGNQGIVTARDYTHDPDSGLNCHDLAQLLQTSQDPRVKYVIWDRHIMAGAGGPQPWQWRPYTGSNPHTAHLHLSVRPEKQFYDDTRAWGWEGDNMPLSDKDIDRIADAVTQKVWNHVIRKKATEGPTKAGALLAWTWHHAKKARQR